jgi:cytochrome P450
MTVVDLNPYSHAFHDDPFPIYRDLRDNAPCYYNADLDFWALSRYEDVLAALHDPQTYCSRHGVTLEQQNALPMLLTTDPPAHTDLRRRVSRAFTPRRVADMESAVRELAQEFLVPLLDNGEGDLVADYAARLPMDVIARLLGVPADDEESLRVWTNALLDRDEGVPDVTPAGIDAAINLFKYFSRFVAERRVAISNGTAPDDLTTALCTAGAGADELSDEQVVGFCFLLIIAGNETTTKLLANCLLALQQYPGERAKVVHDSSRIPDAIEEILRYEGSTQLMARTLTRPVDLHGEHMPEGAKVLLLLGSANRDERVWDRPDEFSLDRVAQTPGTGVQHVGFGHGIHVCLGAALARLEMRVSLEEILRSMPDYEIDEAACTRVHSGNVRGWATMPIRCRP